MFKNLNIMALGFKASFYETLDLASLGGFEGIDPNVPEIIKLIGEKSVDEIINALDEKGLRWGGWSLPLSIGSREEDFKRALKKLPSIAEKMHDLGCFRAFTWLTPYSDELTFEENFDLHKRRVRRVAEILDEYNCVLGVEFVGPKTSRVGHKYEFIHDMEGMMRLIEATGADNIGLLLDSWHWYTSHGTVDQILSLKGRDIIYVHINDAPPGIPVDEQIDSIRRLPGETGIIDIIGFLRALKRIGYDGPVTPEPFDEKLRRMPIREAILKTSEAVNKVWSMAGL
mgnify:CR=1 FL=1